MTLIQTIVAIFERELTVVFKREAEDKTYMNQSVLGCRWRAFWGILVAINKSFPEMVKTLALSIALHRTKHHGDNKTKTIRTLSRSLGDEKTEKATGASTMSFWTIG